MTEQHKIEGATKSPFDDEIELIREVRNSIETLAADLNGLLSHFKQKAVAIENRKTKEYWSHDTITKPTEADV